MNEYFRKKSNYEKIYLLVGSKYAPVRLGTYPFQNPPNPYIFYLWRNKKRWIKTKNEFKSRILLLKTVCLLDLPFISIVDA